MSAPAYNPDPFNQPPPPPYSAEKPPEPGFHQPYPPPRPPVPAATTTVHVVTQPLPQQMVIIGSLNGRITCPNCNHVIQSKTTKSPGLIAWISAGALCLFGCWFGCCLIPFCVDSCMDVEHRCPNCDAHLGTQRPL
ncbi:unnamed protein product [Orchesella dallaii]|uniref:LITAF domain-containing protein n=1 Tax=Orchesella dallaii TaxID=48710 RepID=A0ABP1RYJ9_9HEXA